MNLISRLRRGVDTLASWPHFSAASLASARQTFVDNRTENLFFGVHRTWAEAEAEAAAFGAVGYDNDTTTELYTHRVRKDQHDYPALYWIYRSLQEGHRTVFDVGGNIGIKYLAFRDAIGSFPGLVWRVQDVPAVIARGRELAAERGDNPPLEFSSEFSDGDGIDLLYASGVLQYLPETLGTLLGRYKKLPRRIVINTVPIHAETEYFTVNSIWTAYCPYRVQTQAGLIRGLSELGYRMRETWVNPDKPLVIPGRPDLSLRNYVGFCLDLQR